MRAGSGRLSAAASSRSTFPARALDGKRQALQNIRDAFIGVLGASYPTFTAALAAAVALPPVATFDQAPFDLDPVRDSAVAFAEDLARTLTSLHTALAARAAKTQEQLDAYDNATTAPAQADALQAGAKALLGDAFVLVPEFSLSAANGGQ